MWKYIFVIQCKIVTVTSLWDTAGALISYTLYITGLITKSFRDRYLRSIVLKVHVWNKAASFFLPVINNFGNECTNKDTSMRIDSYRRPYRTKIICSKRSYYRGTPIDGNVLDKVVYEPWNIKFNLKEHITFVRLLRRFEKTLLI